MRMTVLLTRNHIYNLHKYHFDNFRQIGCRSLERHSL
jgi:hypothetical protein